MILPIDWYKILYLPISFACISLKYALW
jgi:hypothetical protein